MEVTRIFDLLPHYVEHYPNQDVALACKRNGVWQTFSIGQYIETVNHLSYGFMKLGIKPGDKIAIISANRPEWNMLDMAIMQMGAICVPLYPTISQADYKYILNHAEIRLLFIEGKELRTKIEPILPEVSSIEFIYTFVNQNSGLPYFDQLVELGKAHPQPEALKTVSDSIDRMSLASIIYTSGTTGNPKGVMLSHNNIVRNFVCLRDIPAPWNKRALSFLPLCHAYERMLVYLYQYLGISVYYAENLATIAENIKEIVPTFMTCVPRVLEKIYDKLYMAGKKQPFIRRQLYYWAFNLAIRYKNENRTKWYEFQYRIADKLVYSKWREALGGNFDIVVSGGSAILPHMAAFFSAIHMPVFEGYGLSETSPVIAVMNRHPGGRQFGTVGYKMPDTELRIGENNEIQCRGHNVMLGYYRDPELTAEVIDKEGWLHTGDTGELSPEGVLRITGRLKNIFKTSFGKYINPQMIESKLTESPFIENIVVVGENKKFAAALVAPDFVFLKSWCARHKMPYTTNEEMVKNPVVIARYQKEIKKYNVNFGDWEQIKRFELIPDDWNQNHILTPTLKVKRKVVENLYADRIENLFS
ncbi:MAG: long-chain fatty acid--CoA ligase [Prevotellaceae bacterium]|jgi:long-chain acyl-CoA synthetase|nr:long-chain fatty acid--CoA ligase [Prevotellaceae bacterium]